MTFMNDDNPSKDENAEDHVTVLSKEKDNESSSEKKPLESHEFQKPPLKDEDQLSPSQKEFANYINKISKILNERNNSLDNIPFEHVQGHEIQEHSTKTENTENLISGDEETIEKTDMSLEEENITQHDKSLSILNEKKIPNEHEHEHEIINPNESAGEFEENKTQDLSHHEYADTLEKGDVIDTLPQEKNHFSHPLEPATEANHEAHHFSKDKSPQKPRKKRGISRFFSYLRSHLTQALRIITALSILFVIGYIFGPGLFFTKSRTAVVTANVITITSPIRGEVQSDIPEVGVSVSKDQSLALVQNIVADDKELSHIKIEYEGLQERLSGLKNEYEKLNELKNELKESFDKYKNSIINHLTIQTEKEVHHCAELKSTMENIKVDYLRKEALVKTGTISKSDFDKIKFERTSAEEAVKQSESAINLLNQQIQSLKNGVFIHPDGRAEVPYQLQRIHEIAMKQSDLNTQIFEINGQLQDKKTQLENETHRFELLKKREITVPTNGVVIRKLITKGNQIAENQPLIDIIDCSHVYVDVTIGHGYFEKIVPGQKVDVKLIGSEDSIKGTISGFRGGAIQADKSTNYIGLPMIDKNVDMQVFIAIDENDLKKIKGDFCHVGRHAVVTF